jgi:hypothetical protein
MYAVNDMVMAVDFQNQSFLLSYIDLLAEKIMDKLIVVRYLFRK